MKKSPFLSKYLEFYIRIGAYASGLYFSSSIVKSFQSFLPEYLTEIFIWFYGIILFEISRLIVKRFYKPKFKKQSENYTDIDNPTSKEPILINSEYEYRLRNEKYIYQLSIYYIISVVITLFLQNTTNVENNYAMLGIFGIIAQFFNFMGCVSVISTKSSRSFLSKIPFLLTGYSFIILALLYVLYTFYLFVLLKFF